MPVVKYRSYKINYTIQGEGQVLVFLHGFGEDLRMWADFLPDFDQYQIICIDLLGFGQSDCIPNTSISLMAKTVKAVFDQEQISKRLLIGHSVA